MPCASAAVSASSNADATDLLFVHPGRSTTSYQPATCADVVAAVAQSALAQRSLRAVGSNWSLSQAGVAEDLIDTSRLNLHLCRPIGPRSQALPAARLRGSGGDLLTRVVAAQPQLAARHFVHVEAGVKIHALLDDLGRCGLSLPTMGDGAGQSLVGAMSTGTHGGDLRVPPLIEWVRAVHLVDASGQEIWITRTGSPFANPAWVKALPDWCGDARLIDDDEAFAAVRVGVGRLGVIYAVVLEVVSEYTLIEVNLEHRWSELQPLLAASTLNDTGATGVFDQVLGDLDSGWFRDETLKRTLISADQNPRAKYHHGPPITDLPSPYYAAHPEFYQQVLADLGFTQTATALRGAAPVPLHHINLAISLSSPERCWMRRRWKREGALAPLNVAPEPDDDLISAVKANKTRPRATVPALRDKLAIDSGLWLLGMITHNAQVQRLNGWLYYGLDAIAQQHEQWGATSGEALFSILHQIAHDSVLEAGPSVAQAASDVIGGSFSRLLRAGPASGPLGQNMLDAHDYGIDGAQAGNSAEFHFDAAGSAYLDFVARVTASALDHFPILGYIGIRFTPASSALIAMQQYPLTASIEVSTPRTRLNDFYADFWTEVHTAAAFTRGIPHWGQEMRTTAEELQALYGERLRRWRNVLFDLSGSQASVFRTGFSQDKGLEPDWTGAKGVDDALDLFLMALSTGDQ